MKIQFSRVSVNPETSLKRYRLVIGISYVNIVTAYGECENYSGMSYFFNFPERFVIAL